jgi:hypothetical protein
VSEFPTILDARIQPLLAGALTHVCETGYGTYETQFQSKLKTKKNGFYFFIILKTLIDFIILTT